MRFQPRLMLNSRASLRRAKEPGARKLAPWETRCVLALETWNIFGCECVGFKCTIVPLYYLLSGYIKHGDLNKYSCFEV